MPLKIIGIVFLLHCFVSAQRGSNFNPGSYIPGEHSPVQNGLHAYETGITPTEKRKLIESLLNGSFFDTTICGITISDLTDSSFIFRKNENLLLRPASNLKLLTSAAAFLFLDSTTYFRTKLSYTGKIRGHILDGNLVITGGGDPCFSVTDIDSFTDALKKAGIKKIKGNLTADQSFLDSLYWGEGWMWDDDPSPDAPRLSALSINKNSTTVILNCSEKGSILSFAAKPDSRYFTFANKLSPAKKNDWDVTVTRDFLNHTNKIIFQGTKGRTDTCIVASLNIENPAGFFLYFMKERLAAQKIDLSGKLSISPPEGPSHLIAEITRDPKLVQLEMNKTSDNLDAEMLLRLLGSKNKTHHISARDGIRYIDSLITMSGFNPANYRITDGSGVSHYNLVSPALLCGVLSWLYHERPTVCHNLIETLPISGVDGTLQNRMKNTVAEKRVMAKTGTLSGVSCLSGYVTSSNSHIYAFSIMLENYTESASWVRGFQDEICKILAQ